MTKQTTIIVIGALRVNVSFENLYLCFLREDTCLVADLIIVSIWTEHLFFDNNIISLFTTQCADPVID